MNITQESTGDLTATIKINIVAEDYSDNVNKAIKEYQKKASFKGFRPGKVPASLIQKMYGKSMLADEVNKLLSDSLSKYLFDNKINILGQPLPNRDKNESVDFDVQTEFDFYFDIGMSPEIALDLSENIEVDKYDIEIDDEMLGKEILALRKRLGKYSKADTAGEMDMVHGEIAELDETGKHKENGIKNHANITLTSITNNSVKDKIIGANKGDKIIFKSDELLANEAEAAFMLGRKIEEIKNISSDFEFIIEEIHRVELAELNEEFYNKISPGITNEDEFREKVKQGLADQLNSESNKKLNDEIVEHLTEKISFNVPEEFLKRWLKETNEKITDEQLVNEFPHFLGHVKWDIIENKIIKDNDIKVEPEETKDFARVYARNQMLSYGIGPEYISDTYLESFSEDLLKKEDTLKKIYDSLYKMKVLELIKTKIKIKDNKIKFDEFLKLETHHHDHD